MTVLLLQKSIVLKHISLCKSLQIKDGETNIKYQCLVLLSLVCEGARTQPKSEFLQTKAVAFIVLNMWDICLCYEFLKLPICQGISLPFFLLFFFF